MSRFGAQPPAGELEAIAADLERAGLHALCIRVRVAAARRARIEAESRRREFRLEAINQVHTDIARATAAAIAEGSAIAFPQRRTRPARPAC